jgi:DNA-3-methyladenine glycosylase II
MRKYTGFWFVGHFEIIIQAPFNFSLTVAKPAGWHWSTPREVFKKNTLWSGTYVNSTPVGLKMVGSGNTVNVDFYTQSPLAGDERDELRARIELGLGKQEDLGAFYDFAKDDDILSSVVKDLYGMRAGRADSIFDRVILAITLQMAPVKRSEDMMAKLLDKYGAAIAFDNEIVVLWPTASEVAQSPPLELRRVANLGYRAERLVNAARYLAAHPMSPLELERQSESDAKKNVMKIPGIGEYSASLILRRSSAPVDVWSAVIISELLFGKTPEHPRQEIGYVTEMMNERWRKWSWMAFVYVLNDLPKLARRYKLSRVT